MFFLCSSAQLSSAVSALVCPLSEVEKALIQDRRLEACVQDPNTKQLLFTYLFHLGELLAVEDKEGQYLEYVVLDVKWLFRDVVGTLFDIPGHITELNRVIRQAGGLVFAFLHFFFCFVHQIPYLTNVCRFVPGESLMRYSRELLCEKDVSRQFSEEAVCLAVQVLEKMGLCLLLGVCVRFRVDAV